MTQHKVYTNFTEAQGNVIEQKNALSWEIVNSKLHGNSRRFKDINKEIKMLDRVLHILIEKGV